MGEHQKERTTKIKSTLEAFSYKRRESCLYENKNSKRQTHTHEAGFIFLRK